VQHSYQTERLLLKKLTLKDKAFFLELVNTPEWLRFIGDRNIRTLDDSTVRIKRIINSPKTNYWVVRLLHQQIPIGIVTFIKRDYLKHFDIGFAFLSSYEKKGYAYEATTAVLRDIIKNPSYSQIKGTTVKGNENSIKLLEKLGLRFQGEIEVENELLLVYSAKRSELFLSDIKFWRKEEAKTKY
jgi:ribosomal-protein-alanine N-acetyltransferase